MPLTILAPHYIPIDPININVYQRLSTQMRATSTAPASGVTVASTASPGTVRRSEIIEIIHVRLD